ncbi:D-alanyl-D-alanine carboxypeptidase family protein [Enterovirga sp. CN4-39]|uniref:D-alanyl-D-alanine carboxypeptidase family protein n=1 Tax=Enterovirga sp. CN4-39 TaxID=3400910 RepID=UPI003C04157C
MFGTLVRPPAAVLAMYFFAGTGAAFALTPIPEPSPSLHAPRWIVIDAISKRVLLARAPDEQDHPASTSKLLTLILWHRWVADRDQKVVITGDHLEHGTTARLQVGDEVSLGALAYAMILPSGNEAARAIADYVGRLIRERGGAKAGTTNENIARFVEEMNVVAKELGCRSSNFTAPSGASGRPVSTARDLALIGAEASRHPDVLEVLRAPTYTIVVTGPNARAHSIKSRTASLARDDGFLGAKTGSTGASPRSSQTGALVAIWDIAGRRVVAVTLDSGGARNRTNDARALVAAARDAIRRP